MKSFVILLITLAITIASPTWPPALFGNWAGIPSQTVVGPWTEKLHWSIQLLADGNFVMRDSMVDNTIITNSSQAFYVSGDQLLYCGILYNYFGTNPKLPAPIWTYLTLQEAQSNATHWQWCESSMGCEIIQWDAFLNSDTQLEMKVKLWDPVVHAHFILNKVSDLDVSPLTLEQSQDPCNFSAYESYQPQHGDHFQTFLSIQSSKGKCPFHNRQTFRSKSNKSPHLVSVPLHPQAGYQHCYQLNDAMGYQIMWSMDMSSQLLNVQMSANTNKGDWIGFGFQPQFPGMNGSDIVMGYLATNGDECVRPMHANRYVGRPDDDTNLKLLSTQVDYENGRTVVRFTRPFNSGQHNIPVHQAPFPQAMPFTIIFATGAGPLESCTDAPQYHMATRGVWSMDWVNPQTVFQQERVCPDWRLW